MKLIVGLGNPGEKYANTRHNAGFLFVDQFAKEEGFPEFTEKWNALVSERGTGDEKLILLKPLTFMNLSGEAVQKFTTFYKIDAKDLILIFDEVDFDLGTVKLKEKGSAGTHNGVKSVVQCLGTEDFPRLRLGIESRGKTAPEQMPLDAFVLAPFTEEERATFKATIAKGIEILKIHLKDKE